MLFTKVKHTSQSHGSYESQSTKIYKALKQAGGYGLYNYELARVCLSWHRRIGNLRADGVNIQCVRISKGTFKYYLNEEK